MTQGVYDICIIAHITKDIITTPDKVKEMPGGTALYFGAALQHLPGRFTLLTKLAESDLNLLNGLDKLQTHQISSTSTHFFENIYPDQGDYREQIVHSLAEPFTISEIPSITAKYYHLGPLSKQDIPLALIKHLKGRGKISLDAQGLLRDVVDGKVISCQWEQREEGLPLVDVIKVNEYESKTLTGFSDVEVAARELSKFGVSEVVITLGGKGSLIFYNDRSHYIPAFKPASLKDATGCGDTYMAGYLFGRSQGYSVKEAGKFGAAMATLKMNGFGAFNGSAKDVSELIKENS